MATIAAPPSEERVLLHNVAWETYERLLDDHIDSSVPHFTYEQGELEILSPSAEHERVNRTLAMLVEMVAMELAIAVCNVGSMTFKRQDLQRGFEPDSSFYIQHEAHVRSKKEIDLAVDPPPDLVIEIEVTRPAIPKLPLYAAMGVPEVWRGEGERVTDRQLQERDYREVRISAALPPISGDVISRFLSESRSLDRLTWLRQLREWARAHAED